MYFINKIKNIALLVLLIMVLTLILLQTSCSPQAKMSNARWETLPPEMISPEIKQMQAKIPSYNRLVASTYLTYPEWYIVYSSQEYADYLKSNRPSGFPYFSSIAQYWWGYGAVYNITKKRFPFDGGDHLMLAVIGVSYSLEYVIKGLYENSIGRLTELTSGNELTDEERYAQKVAEEYASYIPEYPWFDFSYTKALGGLWTQTSLVGPHMIRKVERKFILSVEYSFKAVYSSIIQAGSHLTFGTADPSVYALADNVPHQIYQQHKNIKLIKTINVKEDIISLPSEQPFTDAVTKITDSGIGFNDIAGNNEILVTAVTPKDWIFDNKLGQLLFTMNILTEPKLHRIAIRVHTKTLLATLRYLQQGNVKIEHVYAY